MSNSPSGQIRFHTSAAARDVASWLKGNPSSTASVRMRAPRSFSASDRRARFSWLISGVRSMSRVAGIGACWAMAAKAPMMTYRTWCRFRAATMAAAFSSGSSPACWSVTLHPPQKWPGAMPEAVRHGDAARIRSGRLPARQVCRHADRRPPSAGGGRSQPPAAASAAL